MNANRAGFRRRAVRFRRRVGFATTWALGLILGGPELAQAQVTGTYKVEPESGITYNSNVYDIPDSQPLQQGQHRADRIYNNGLSADVFLGDPVLSGDLNGKFMHYTYDRNGGLTHNEETGQAKVHYHPGQVLDLQVSYTFERSLAPFEQTLATQIALDTNKTVNAILGLSITPEWRLDINPYEHEALTPLNGLLVGQGAPNQPNPPPPSFASFPDFRLREAGGALTLNYLGITHLTAGFELNYTHGDFSKIAGATKYDQYAGEFVAKYNVDSMSNLSATLGYTLRNTFNNAAGNANPIVVGTPLSPTQVANLAIDFQGAVGRTDGITGIINYNRTLTPKTAFDANLFRLITSYAGPANTLTATGIGGAFHWKPDFKFEINLNATYEQDEFGGGGGTDGFAGNARTDRLFTTNVLVTYFALKWLSATGHFTYQERDSDLSLAGFSGYEVGLDLTATLKN